MKSLEFFRAHSKEIVNPNSDEIRFNCPFCEDTNHHLYVNKIKGLYHCFKCGTSGKIWQDQGTLLDEFKKVSSKVAEFNLPLKRSKAIIKSLPSSQLLFTGQGYNPHQEIKYRAEMYMWSRNLYERDCISNNIGVCTDRGSKYYGMILFPIDGTKYFVARNLGKGPKYINAPWPKEASLFFPKSSPGKIFNLPFDLYISEGVFDGLKLHKLPGISCSLLGKQATVKQLKRLASQGADRYIIVLDPDAFSYAVKLKLELSVLTDKPIKIAMLRDKDPGDSTVDELREALRDENLR